jgi:hypothetical protein
MYEYGRAVFHLLHLDVCRVQCLGGVVCFCSDMYSGGPPGSGAAGVQPFRVQLAPL